MTHQSHIDDSARRIPQHDISGYRIFSAGDVGAAHAMAHRMLDSGRYREGHDLLVAWLAGRTGQGSQWVHIQWHMLVFELAVGNRDAALARFQRYILPVAATTQDALTDAPAALWRIALASPEPIDLPWQVVRRPALAALWGTDDGYVTLHNLLALAGAGDLVTLDRWLRLAGHRDRTLRAIAIGLRGLVAGELEPASRALEDGLAGIPALGGSRAQNQLFVDLHRAMVRGVVHQPTGTASFRLAAIN